MCVLSIPAIGAAEIDVDDTNNTKLTTTDSDVVNQGNDQLNNGQNMNNNFSNQVNIYTIERRC